MGFSTASLAQGKIREKSVDEFQKDIWLSVLDKGFLAIVLAVIAGLVKWLLQRDQAQRDLVREISPKRAEAYERLWKVTEPFCRKKSSEIDQKFRDEMHTKLNEAYFDEGAAMYLSHKASSLFVKAKRHLVDNNTKAAVLIEELSSFRTQLKVDLRIYTKREAETPLET